MVYGIDPKGTGNPCRALTPHHRPGLWAVIKLLGSTLHGISFRY